MQPHSASSRTSLVKIGGSLGIAATLIALAILVAGCFQLDAVFMFSILPLALGLIGMVVTIVGEVTSPAHGDEDMQPAAAMFACLAGIVGGLAFMHVWMHWPKT